MARWCVWFLLIPAVLLFVLGICLVGSTAFTTAGLVLWAVALIGVLASVAISIVRGMAWEKKITRWQILDERLL